jgi:predicted dehydrogenase
VAVTALCDVWRRNREAAAVRVKQGLGAEPKQFTRFPELLAWPEVEAVVIATPDFSHAPILLAALGAGKDVYVEKPMTIDIPSANRALDLARARKRVVQAGTQRRSDGHFVAAARMLAGGAIGKINRISAAMNVNAARWLRRFEDCRESDVDWAAFLCGLPERRFDARLLRCWQLFRETTNGIPGLWMTHYADAVNLLAGSTYPRAAVSLGGNFVWKDGREHADTFQTLVEFPEEFILNWSMGLGNAAGIHFTVHGTKGTLDAEKWTCSNEGAAGVNAGNISSTRIAAERTVGHMENWLQCLRSRARPAADIQFGHQHVVTTVMCAAALATGRKQIWNATKREMVSA